MTIDSIISGGIENRLREITKLMQEFDIAIAAEDLEHVKELKNMVAAQVDILCTLKAKGY